MHEVPPPRRSRSQQESSDLVSSLLWRPGGCCPRVSRDEDPRLTSDSAGYQASGNCFYLNILVSLPFSGKNRKQNLYIICCVRKSWHQRIFSCPGRDTLSLFFILSHGKLIGMGKLVKNKVIEYLPHIKLCGYWDQKMNKMKLDHLVLFIAFQ